MTAQIPLRNMPPNGMLDYGPKSIKYIVRNGVSKEIPLVEFPEGWELRTLILADCGDYVNLDPEDPMPLLAGKSWTDLLVCQRHFKSCWYCGRMLCVGGTNADGFRAEDDDQKMWLCTDCHQDWDKKNKRKEFWQGFKRGFFGADHEKDQED